MSEWISVKDRLPELYKGCLICSEHGNIRTGYYSCHNEWFASEYGQNIIKYVTHWMPLPDLPKEK